MTETTLPLSTNPPVIQSRCTGCGRCVATCRRGALSLATDQPNGFGRKQAVVVVERCSGCGECLPACHCQALESKNLR